jgi:hypothetical protein
MAMRMLFPQILLAVSILCLLAGVVFADLDRCTTMVVGRRAGKCQSVSRRINTGTILMCCFHVDGPMTTHTADCSDCDFRINKVPAMDWPKDSMRPLYVYKGNYPSTISSYRGDTWLPSNLEGTKEQREAWGEESVITGYIPQVSVFQPILLPWTCETLSNDKFYMRLLILAATMWSQAKMIILYLFC